MPQVADLIGAPLDYWAGRALDYPPAQLSIRRVPRSGELICVLGGSTRYAPSTDPAQAWPIMDRLGIRTGPFNGGWEAFYCGRQEGPDGLVAAMRAVVFAVFGPIVPDVPVEPDEGPA